MNDAPLFFICRKSPLLVFVLCLVTALAHPANLHSMRGPAPAPAPETVHARPASPQGHIVRMRLGGMSLRMAVDPLARSPLDQPLAVRTARLVSVRLPDPAASGERITRLVAVKMPPRPESPVLTASLAQPALPSRDAAPEREARRAPQTASDETAGVAPQNASPDGSPAPFAAGNSPLRVLTVGDSLSIGLASALEKRLANIPGVLFAKSGKVSSGLARPDFYDWEARLEELAGRYAPDVAVIMIGANDDKSLRAPSGKIIAFGGAGWDAEYARRAQNMLDIVRRHNPAAKIFWVGAPVMASADLDRHLRGILGVIKSQLARNKDAWFVETGKTLADASGRFALSLPSPTGKTVQVRYKDGVHVTPAGADLLAKACLSAIASQGLLAEAAPQRRPKLAELAEK